MAVTVPTFTPTPVIANADPSDMPIALGPRIGDVTDANFQAARTWGVAADDEFLSTKYTTTWITPTLNYRLTGRNTFHECGHLKIAYITIKNFEPYIATSSANGDLPNDIVATLAAGRFRPPTYMFLYASVYMAPPFNVQINAVTGDIEIRGTTALNYTFPSSWTMTLEAMWLA